MKKDTQKEYIPVMLTPFKDNGEVDYEGLTELTAFYLRSGAAGLFANCLSSEMYELSAGERLDILQHIIRQVNGTVPVVASGTFGHTIREQALFTQKVYDTGVKAVIIVTGMLAEETETDAVFSDRVFRFLELTGDIPLGFYECPVPYKRLILPEQLKQFVATERILYHKDTCMDIGQVKAKLAAANGHQFGLYDAYMGHAVESLKAGAAGLSCIQGNYWPELIVWLCDHYDDTDREKEVAKVQQFFIDNMDVMHDVYPITAKYCLQKRGMAISSFTRQQVGMFTEDIRKKIDRLYADYECLQEQLDIKNVL